MDGSRLRPEDAPHQKDAESSAALEGMRLGWRPIVARNRCVLGVRIDVKTAAGATPMQSAVGALSAALSQHAPTRGLVVVASHAESLEKELEAISRCTSQRGIVLEIGAEALTSRHVPMIDAALAGGARFVLRASGHPLPRDWQRLFIAVVHGAAGSVAPDGGPALWIRDTMTRTDIDCALMRGAQATIGWPLDEPAVDPSAGLEPTRRTVLDIIRLIQGDADVIALERAFKSEPTLSMLLLSVVNSPAMAPGAATAPITSLRHAILVLGYKRLVRWLVLLLGVSSSNARSTPLIYVAVQRGFFLEALAGCVGAGKAADDLFVVGAFSLLQQITGHSHDRLFASAVLPRPVLDAVRAHEGIYGAYLALAQVVEHGNSGGAERAARLIGVSMADVNAALLSSLAAADAITMH